MVEYSHAKTPPYPNVRGRSLVEKQAGHRNPERLWYWGLQTLAATESALSQTTVLSIRHNTNKSASYLFDGFSISM